MDISTHDGDEAAKLFDLVEPLYAEVYAEPPYLEGPDDVAAFEDAWARHTSRPGFRLVLVRISNDEPMVGFAYGHLLPGNTNWWDNLIEPLPTTFTQETGSRTFAVIELAVRKPHRRRGVAATLHNTLLADNTGSRTTLAVRPEPEAAPARTAYTKWGYRKVGEMRPRPDAPIYDLMISSH